MAKILSTESVKYVLKSDREAPEAERSIFHIRPLRWKERSEVQDGVLVTEINMSGPKNQVGKGIMRHLSGTTSRTAIEKGLVKIENLRDAEGNLVKYEEDSTATHKEKVLDSIPPDWTKELSDEILKMSGLSKEEEKN